MARLIMELELGRAHGVLVHTGEVSRRTGSLVDGGFTSPNETLLRVATWAVVLCEPDHFWTASARVVPRLRQTSLRSQITSAVLDPRLSL